MPDQQAPGAPEPDLPPVHIPSGPRRGWGTIGFALIVAGLAGLLFHANQDMSVLRSHLGQISLGLIAVGLVMLLVSALVRARRR